jgi:hypothetical protein
MQFGLSESIPGKAVRDVDLSVGATALLPNLRMTVNPLEIIDFVLGWLGLDVANDDWGDEREGFHRDTGLAGEWFGGASHIHLRPHDTLTDLTIQNLVMESRARGIDFVMPAPHCWHLQGVGQVAYQHLLWSSHRTARGAPVLLGLDTSTFRARGDRDDGWVMIGGSVNADREVRLRWRGRARLYIDGRYTGTPTSDYCHEIEPGSFHVYRIVSNGSYSNHIYANLPAGGRGISKKFRR